MEELGLGPRRHR